jgi:hypothetical protein
MGFLQDHTILNSKRTGSNLSKPLLHFYPSSLLISLFGWWLVDLPHRASNESLLFFSSPYLREEGRWSLPARIERPLLYRGVSASRKDRLLSPFSSPSSPTSLHEVA